MFATLWRIILPVLAQLPLFILEQVDGYDILDVLYHQGQLAPLKCLLAATEQLKLRLPRRQRALVAPLLLPVAVLQLPNIEMIHKK